MAKPSAAAPAAIAQNARPPPPPPLLARAAGRVSFNCARKPWMSAMRTPARSDRNVEILPEARRCARELIEILLRRLDHVDDGCRAVGIHLHHLRRHGDLRAPDLGAGHRGGDR